MARNLPIYLTVLLLGASFFGCATSASLTSTSAAPTLSAGTPYEDTSVRLMAFVENRELEELEHDFETRGTATSREIERERAGFRAGFGGGAVGGYVQFFAEEVTDGLLPAVFDTYGFGGGVLGTPRVGGNESVALIVPFKVGLDVGAGIETVGSFDEELVYVDLDVEVGFGARVVGLQPSVGVAVNQYFGLHESDDPADPSHLDPTVITGTNFGGFAEVLYKPDGAPLFGWFRGTFGDIPGVHFGIGFAF